MRNLSSATLTAAFAQETDEVLVVLVTIDHDDLPTPLRVTSDTVTTVSRGNSFVPYPFDLILPSDEEGSPPVATVTIDNVDREITNTLRSLNSAATFTIEVVRGASPDDVEVSYEGFELKAITGDAVQISGSLTMEDIASEPYPHLEFTPSRFRGLFS